MARKLLFLSSLLLVLLIPSALLAAEPVDAAGCDASQGLMAQIFGDQPVDPAEPPSPFAVPQEKSWCGACLDYDCGANDCYPCTGHVYACAPRCTPICWCSC